MLLRLVADYFVNLADLAGELVEFILHAPWVILLQKVDVTRDDVAIVGDPGFVLVIDLRQVSFSALLLIVVKPLSVLGKQLCFFH